MKKETTLDLHSVVKHSVRYVNKDITGFYIPKTYFDQIQPYPKQLKLTLEEIKDESVK